MFVTQGQIEIFCSDAGITVHSRMIKKYGNVNKKGGFYEKKT